MLISFDILSQLLLSSSVLDDEMLLKYDDDVCFHEVGGGGLRVFLTTRTCVTGRAI